ncbi:addiction module protein [Candidatus Sumerlaeota bacterium]|nr:addiction module protein [Candidatus Sumerlaeota bacterium]
MSTTVEKVRDEALSLSVSERASLAHDLILSLENPADFELSREQEAEIARRVQSVREGTAQGRPVAEVFADIRARFGK